MKALVAFSFFCNMRAFHRLAEGPRLQTQVSTTHLSLPTASACYPTSDPSSNCTKVIDNWFDGNWRSSMPGSMEAPNLEVLMLNNGTMDACYLNTTITGWVNFAVKHNLNLVVKNTGHDVLGPSVAQGAPANETYDAVTLGTGTQWHETYDTVNQHGRMMVGGISPGGSVGAAGGWLAGGGHSTLSPTYGLGTFVTDFVLCSELNIDIPLKALIIVSMGDYLTVNNYQNPDLFWALRGGGGSTYGIVTSLTYYTYPSVPVQSYHFQANVTNSSAMLELVGELLHSQTQFTGDGWGGYGSVNNQAVSFLYSVPNMTSEAADVTTQAWTNYVLSLEPWGVTSATTISSMPSWYEFYETTLSTGVENGGNIMMSSRLLSQDTVANTSKEVAQALIDSGGKVNQINPDSLGVNPAWRNAVVQTSCEASWQDGATSTEIDGIIDQLKGRIKTIPWQPQASSFEIDWQETFFGSHHSTLKSIKNKYDPHKLFVVAQGVGADDWNQELTCRS
ncbi:hypothetical protein PAXINDRAFT_13592 [Paxillus involutus ATCC 200175]|uniref:Berberine/berberine-like domain-containing protein n=1 Tax=Paxillus involutus ATCC 200175 TaxID=664439 RepID=A0A0C9TDK0_PAXIN|nr:hypothetical protein PAXINDRAFT_13592 [Paxillus involutus ATCC 200175]